MPVCENCGTGLPVGYEYCYQCGCPVRGLPPDDHDARPGVLPPAPPPPTAGAPDLGVPVRSLPSAPTPTAGAPGFGRSQPLANAQVLATWGTRFAAALIDYLVVAIAVFVPVVLVLSNRWGGEQNVITRLRGDSGSSTALLLEVGLFGVFFLYNLVCEAAFQATLGKRLLNLRVVGYGGARPGFGGLFVRNVTKALSCGVPLVNVVVGLPLALVMIAVDHDRQRIGDRLAHTYVLRDVVAIVAPGTPR
jgi:uncharacterized RDD family membrane protein YckC